MKFLYEYRTSDNAKHSGTISAASRDAAYAAIKVLGVRPSRVVEAPGFFNKLFGKGKRWLAIAALGVLVIIAIFVIHAENRTIRTIKEAQSFVPSPAFVELRAQTDALLLAATNDVSAARDNLRALFRKHYPLLPDKPREREEAEALYGRASIRLDALDAGERKIDTIDFK